MKEQVSVAKCCADCGQSVFNHDEKVCHRKKIFNQAQVNEDDMRQLLTQSPGFVTLEREEYERLKRLDDNVKKKIAKHEFTYESLAINEPKRFECMQEELSEIKLLKSLYDENTQES